MSRITSRLALALALSTMGAIALSSTAQANVRTTTHGSACSFVGSIQSVPRAASPGPGNLLGFVSHNGPFIGDADPFVTSNQDYNTYFPVMCPLTRQLPLSTAGMSDLEVRFVAHRQFAPGYEPVRRAYCDVFSVRSDGTPILFKQREVIIKEGINAPATVLDFGDDLDQSSSKGHYYVTCWLPYTVALQSIYHSEVDGIDGN